MRRLRAVIPVVVLVVAPAFLAGCAPSDAGPMKTDPKVVMNPSGDASKLPPQAQGMAEQQRQAGEASVRNMDEAAAAMRAAQARSGGR